MFLLEMADQPKTITVNADDYDNEDIPTASSASEAKRMLGR